VLARADDPGDGPAAPVRDQVNLGGQPEAAFTPATTADLLEARRTLLAAALDPDAVARAIAFAIDQPDDVEIGDITIGPGRPR